MVEDYIKIIIILLIIKITLSKLTYKLSNKYLNIYLNSVSYPFMFSHSIELPRPISYNKSTTHTLSFKQVEPTSLHLLAHNRTQPFENLLGSF